MTPAEFFTKKVRHKETVIRLPGGNIVVPGHASTPKGLATLIARAIAQGTARVEPKTHRS